MKAPSWSGGRTSAATTTDRRKKRRYIAKPGSPLPAREQQFLRLMCSNGCKSLKYAGRAMGVTHNTLSEYVKRLKIRTGANSTYQLGVWARDNGYADPVSPKSNGHARADAVAREATEAGL